MYDANETAPRSAPSFVHELNQGEVLIVRQALSHRTPCYGTRRDWSSEGMMMCYDSPTQANTCRHLVTRTTVKKKMESRVIQQETGRGRGERGEGGGYSWYRVPWTLTIDGKA